MKYPVNNVATMLSNEKFDLIIANELDALILAGRIAERVGAKILFDAHEYEPKRIENHWFHRLFINPYKDFLCRKYLPEVSSMSAVSYVIASEYNKVYGVEPQIILNVPRYQKIQLKEIDPANIRIIYHGLAQPSRALEDIIYLMPLLDKRFYLTLMFVVRDVNYFNYLKKLAEQVSPGRIDFWKSVPFDNIIPTISQFDIELIVYKPTSFNVAYSLPNKLFEAVMAGLPVVIGPYPEMKRIIKEFGCGLVADSFEPRNVAAVLNSLTPEEIMEKKRVSLKAATILNAEKEMKKLLSIIEGLLNEKTEG